MLFSKSLALNLQSKVIISMNKRNLMTTSRSRLFRQFYNSNREIKPLQNSKVLVGLESQKAFQHRSFFSASFTYNAKPDVIVVPGKISVIRKTVRYFFVGCGLISGSFFLALVSFFIYDYTTYTPPIVSDNLVVPAESINLPIGGPENLPIVTSNIDALDTEKMTNQIGKPRLVILGSGWGSVSLLNQLNPDDYDVTVISPTNYFLFTPMLPCAAVGTLELKTLMESIRSIVHDVNGHFLQAKAEKIEFSENLIKVKDISEDKYFYVPYDKLVIAVGSISNTHGVEGLQYSNQLKTAEDALEIRRKIIHNFEKASLPSTSEIERKRLLSFVICGAGPTGVEMAAEIYDLINEDLPRLYPKLLRQEVSIHIIQSRSHILNTYDQQISEYAMNRFEHDQIDLLTNSRVQKILPDRVLFNQKNSDGVVEPKEVSFGLCLWSTGVGQNPFTQQVANDLKPFQKNRRALETDSQLRVIGAPLGHIYAIGDCSTVRTDISEHCEDYIRRYIIDHHKKSFREHSIVTDDDIKHFDLTHPELNDLCYQISKKHPLAREALSLAQELIPKYDTKNTGHLNFEQLKFLFKEVDSKVTALPATAQRAHQEGAYLGKKLSKLSRSSHTLEENNILGGDVDNALCQPFKYTHLGSLAYIGNSAVFDLPGHSFVGGLVAMYLWRSIYFAQSVSIRTRVLLFFDWLKRGVFGRDILAI